jgi:alpha-L-fucosidase
LPENQPIPKEISWQFNIPKKGSKITLVETGESVKWHEEGNVVKVFLPSSVINTKDSKPALAFSFIADEN